MRLANQDPDDICFYCDNELCPPDPLDGLEWQLYLLGCGEYVAVCGEHMLLLFDEKWQSLVDSWETRNWRMLHG